MSLNLTEKAAAEMKRIITQQNSPDSETDAFIRVGVKGGGCAGFDYILDLADRRAEGDELFDQHGVKLICDPKSYLYLSGVTIDFKDELMGRGFVFNNPNASGSCGCGASFSV